MEKIKTEFHVHTRISKDSFLGKYLLLFMCKIHQIKCIAISDHNEIKGALKYKSFLERFNIKVIVSEEILTCDGEIIGMFLNKKIEAGKTAKETVNEIKEQNGIVYIPHPYDKKRENTVIKKEALEEIIDDVELIEAYNGRNVSEEFEKKQKNIVKKYDKTPVVGSDAHCFFEIGRNYMYMDNAISRNEIVNSIRNGLIYKKKCIKFAHKWTKIVKMFKMIFGGRFDELFRIINKRCRRRKQKACK